MDSKEAEADVPNNIRPAPQSPEAAVSENSTLLPSVEKERYKTRPSIILSSLGSS